MKKLLIMVFSILLLTQFMVQAENEKDYSKYKRYVPESLDKKMEIKMHLRDYLEKVKSETNYEYVINNCNEDLLYFNIKEISKDEIILDQFSSISYYFNYRLNNKFSFDIYEKGKTIVIKCS